ncbi:MAG TPA: carboxypeptidase regulatory-like domain-containing protein [Acidobacteriaceae bacterium]|nr:carboxypeptidase regulatory-like domain-containing protein [Acidobacteriaceae bacterium]
MRFPHWAQIIAPVVFVFSQASTVVHAQSNSSGTVTGEVLGPDGARIVHAHVALALPDAPPQSGQSNDDGTFTLKGLSSGTYTLKVQAAGFATAEQSSVAVAVGRTTHLVVALHLATAATTVDVSAAPVTFDTTQTSSVVNIDRDRVEELPIPSRNYLSFVLLSPQAAPANPALFEGGGAVSGVSFSFGGLRPGSNAIYLDDVNDNDEYTGGSRTQLSPEAISDFQIVNHGFQPQSGGGAGGSIDVQTRSGVNRLHGDAFIFVQNGGLNATPPLGIYSRKPDESRVRAGVALGGPIRRDKTFYYVAGEQEMANGEDANDLHPATADAINAAQQKYRPMSSTALHTGLFPTVDQETELSGRIDQTLTAEQALMIRYAFTNARNVNDAFNTGEHADPSARGSAFIADNSLNATLSSTLSSTMTNRASFELAQRRAESRTGTASGPGTRIAGVAYFGTPYAGNDRRFETHVEFADTFSRQVRQHLMQFGARVDRVDLRASVPNASQGYFVFSNLAAFQNGSPDFFTQSFGNFQTNFDEVRLAAFAQDHWTAKTLTLDYGIRYDYNQLPSLPEAALNFSPRLGLAWNPFKRTVVRGGFGTFYDRFELSTINHLIEFNGTAAFTQIAEDTAAVNLYQSGQTPTAPLPGIATSLWRADPKLRNPYSEVASLSVEQALPLQTTLTGEYQWVRGVHMGRSSNVNLSAPVLLTEENAASLGVSHPAAQQLGRLVFGPAHLNPQYDAINQFSTSAASSYNGATLTLNRQFQDDLQILVGYTYSKTLDNASYDLEQPQNPYAQREERSLSLQDQRHRLTLSGLWLIGPDLGDPADAASNANPGPFMKALYGLEFAPIVSITTGFRANPITGADSNREHIYPFAARPLGLSRNALKTAANVNFDFRVLKMVAIRGGHLDIVAESFNILNHPNFIELNNVFGSDIKPTQTFGTPIAASTARRIQFSLDYEF